MTNQSTIDKLIEMHMTRIIQSSVMVIGFSFLPNSPGYSFTISDILFSALWICTYMTTALTGWR